MTELRIIATEPSTSNIGFWKRQFALNHTPKQIMFDVIFGVIGPVLCFIFDPIFFQSQSFGPALFPEYQVLVYVFSGLEISTLCLWLVTRGSFRFSNQLIGGCLILGGLVSFLLGLILFPFSVLGIAIVYGIGLVGFTPFLTGIVYWRNGVRALCSEPESASLALRSAAFFLGVVLLSGVPVVLSATLHSYFDYSMSEVLRGDSRHALTAARDLWPLAYLASSELDRLVQAYIREPDPARKEILKNCYREITGEDIELRVQILLD